MTQTNESEIFDAVVIGGGPAGATAANDLARRGHSVLLLDREGRTKPCGGAIPPRLIKDFAIPDEPLVAAAEARGMTPHRYQHPSGERLQTTWVQFSRSTLAPESEEPPATPERTPFPTRAGPEASAA